MTTKGQATIPEEIRLLLGILPGDKILYRNPDPRRKRAIIEVVSTRNVVEDLAGSLNTKVKFVSRAKERELAGKALEKHYEVGRN